MVYIYFFFFYFVQYFYAIKMSYREYCVVCMVR